MRLLQPFLLVSCAASEAYGAPAAAGVDGEASGQGLRSRTPAVPTRFTRWYPTAEHPTIVKESDLTVVEQLEHSDELKMKDKEGRLLYVRRSPPLTAAKGTDEWMYSMSNTKKIADEVDVYRQLEGRRIAPQFRGLLEDSSGQVNGFMSDWIDGEHPDSRPEKEKCYEKLQKLHSMVWVHGFAIPRSCIIDEHGEAWLVNLEGAHAVKDTDPLAMFRSDRWMLGYEDDSDDSDDDPI